MIKNVKLINVDQPRYFPPTRVLEIQTSVGTLITPNRATTVYELNRKKELPTGRPIENKILIEVTFINTDKFHSIFENNQSIYRLIQKIRYLSEHYHDYHDIIYCLQPANEVLKMIESLPKSKQLAKINEFIKRIIRIQILGNLSNICIPYLGNMDMDDYKRVLKNLIVELEEINYHLIPGSIIPLLKFNYPNFNEIIDFIVQELGIKMVGVYYADPARFLHNYLYLEEYADKDVAFISLNVKRYHEKLDDFATMHFLPFMEFDIYAVSRPAFPSKTTRKRNKILGRVNALRFFDRKELKLLRLLLLSKDHMEDALDEIAREINIREYDPKLQEILEGIKEEDPKDFLRDDEKYSAINSLTRVHELIASTNEFNNLSKLIVQNDTASYIQEKRTLDHALTKLRLKRRLLQKYF